MITMRVHDLATCPRHNRPVLTLVDRDTGRWHLTFWLPPNEAERLALVLGLTGHQCVAVFDLVLALLTRFERRVLGAVLDAGDEGVSATLRVGHVSGEVEVACHPADALALAEHAKAPIQATARTLRYARLVPATPDDAEGAWLASLRPDDFRAPGTSPAAGAEE